MKGFVFTIDSSIALTLALFAISAMLFISGTPESKTAHYYQVAIIADDSIQALSEEKVSQNETSLENIGRFVSIGETDAARDIVKSALGKTIPEQFGFSVEYEGKDGGWNEIYARGKRSPDAAFSASSVRVVSGKKSAEVRPALQCISEDCPFCRGFGKMIPGENYGPIAVRVTVWG